MLDLTPFCEIVQVVGSVRRRAPVVHDIEILLLPKPGTVKDLFGGLMDGSLFDENFPNLVKQWDAQIMQNGPKRKKLRLCEGPVLELRVGTLAGWAVETVISTGPAEFSQKCVTIRRKSGYLPSNCRVSDGWQVFRNEHLVKLKDESDFLKLLGFPGDLDPEERNGAMVPVSAETVMV
jgi:DNA polymerase/3'-5' exonuclease PolX